MNTKWSGQKLMGWITIGFLILFLLIGIGIISGVFLPSNLFPNSEMRMLMGLILIGYSAIRGIFVFKNLKA